MGLALGAELFPPAYPVETVGRLGRRNKIACGGVSTCGRKAVVMVQFSGEPTAIWPKPYAVLELEAELDSTWIVNSGEYAVRDEAMSVCHELVGCLP